MGLLLIKPSLSRGEEARRRTAVSLPGSDAARVPAAPRCPSGGETPPPCVTPPPPQPEGMSGADEKTRSSFSSNRGAACSQTCPQPALREANPPLPAASAMPAPAASSCRGRVGPTAAPTPNFAPPDGHEPPWECDWPHCGTRSRLQVDVAFG